jgi:hypothetical protein
MPLSKSPFCKHCLNLTLSLTFPSLQITDGYCASTCAIFAEQMETGAGVKSVVFGGVPAYGPMQAVPRTRGSNDASLSDNIASSIVFVVTALNQSLESLFPGFTVGRCPYQGCDGTQTVSPSVSYHLCQAASFPFPEAHSPFPRCCFFLGRNFLISLCVLFSYGDGQPDLAH